MEINQDMVEAIAAAVIKGLEGRTESHPVLMSTRDVARMKGCSTYTVRRNWQSWGLQLMGKGASGGMRFSGASVRRHLKGLNEFN